MDPRLLAFGPAGHLQTHPNTASLIFALSPEQGRVEAARKPVPGAPLPLSAGHFLGMLVCTGPRTEGRFGWGKWSFDMGPDEEQIALVRASKALVGCSALELRVYPLVKALDLDTGVKLDEPPVWRGKGSRLTTWSELDGAPGKSVLADAKRGLALKLDAEGRLVMDWYHRAKASVFFEIDALVDERRRHGGPPPAMRVVLQRDTATGQPWYRAKETVFETLR